MILKSWVLGWSLLTAATPVERGVQAMQQGDYSEAVEQFRHHQQLVDGRAGAPDLSSALAALRLADALVAAGRSAERHQLLTQLLRWYPAYFRTLPAQQQAEALEYFLSALSGLAETPIEQAGTGWQRRARQFNLPAQLLLYTHPHIESANAPQVHIQAMIIGGHSPALHLAHLRNAERTTRDLPQWAGLRPRLLQDLQQLERSPPEPGPEPVQRLPPASPGQVSAAELQEWTDRVSLASHQLLLGEDPRLRTQAFRDVAAIYAPLRAQLGPAHIQVVLAGRHALSVALERDEAELAIGIALDLLEFQQQALHTLPEGHEQFTLNQMYRALALPTWEIHLQLAQAQLARADWQEALAHARLALQQHERTAADNPVVRARILQILADSSHLLDQAELLPDAYAFRIAQLELALQDQRPCDDYLKVMSERLLSLPPLPAQLQPARAMAGRVLQRCVYEDPTWLD